MIETEIPTASTAMLPTVEAPPRGEAAELWSEFRRGAFEPSVHAIGVMVVVAALTLVVLLAAGTPQRLAGVHAYLAENGTDDRAFLTIKVLEAHRTGVSGPRVVFLGASSMREGLARDEAEAVLRRTWGDPRLEVLDLTAGGQTPWELLTVAEAVLPVLEGAAVLGLNATFFGEDPDAIGEMLETRRFGFAYPSLAGAAGRVGLSVPEPSGVFLWDQRSYFLSRLPLARRNLLRGRVAHQPHRFDGLPSPRAADWHQFDGRTGERMAAYERHFARNAELLHEAVARLRESGVAVLLVETPLSPRVSELPLFHAWVTGHRERIRQLSAEWGVPYLEPGTRVDLAAADFQDPVHIRNDEARKRYTQALIAELNAALGLACAGPDCGTGDGR